MPPLPSTIASTTDFSSQRFTRMEVGLIWFEGRTIPRWTGALHGIVQPAVHAGIPWLLSRLGPRYGWTAEGPGVWNLTGLISIIAGCALMAWCLVLHMRLAPAGWRIEKTPYYPTPAYLATEGPYRFSRNPIYVAEGMIWIGWMVFFGSLVILAILATLAVVVGPLVLRREEKGLEARFGDAWVRYSKTTPRWFSIRSLRGE